MNKKMLFANNNDQLELLCEIESNPESIFVWYVFKLTAFIEVKF